MSNFLLHFLLFPLLTYNSSGEGFNVSITVYGRIKGNRSRLLPRVYTIMLRTVAVDGSGDYATTAEAVASTAPDKGNMPYKIHIKQGVHNEVVEIPVNKKNIMFIGDGADKTRITVNRGSENLDHWMDPVMRVNVGRNEGKALIALDIQSNCTSVCLCNQTRN